MGYSLTLEANNQDQQTKILNWLFDNTEKLWGEKSAVGIFKEPSYAPEIPFPVGFDYSSWISYDEWILVHEIVKCASRLFNVNVYYDDEQIENTKGNRLDPKYKRTAYEMMSISKKKLRQTAKLIESLENSFHD